MKRFITNWNLIGFIFLTFLVLGNVVGEPVSADEVVQLQQQIDELEKLKRLSEDATKPLEQQVTDLSRRIDNARAGIVRARQQSEELADQITQREADLARQYQVLARRILEQYKKARMSSSILLFFATADASELTKDLAYRSSVKAQDNRLIQSIGSEIFELEADKQKLESDQILLAKLQIQLDSQADFFKNEIAKAKNYQQELTGKIAELSAKQRAIIAARSGSFTTSVGNVPIGSDFNGSIAGFMQNAPSSSFAVFSFGGHTHRNGMSQYGAKGRADVGQSAEEILKAYYPNASLKKDFNSMGQITVDGHGSMSFEEHYLFGIYEVPESWPKEVLKAQAIAARTYAIRRTNNGQSSICATEACQVFRSDLKTGAWRDAVNETRGWVLVNDDGSPALTQYASTHGGYSNTSGWDTTDKTGDGKWSDRAWDAIANSPWFYKAWYRQGYSNSSNNCGRNPWLSEEEMADILNAYLLRQNPGGADTGRILPVTIGSCPIGGQSGDPYSMAELRNLVSNPVISISGTPVVTHNNNAITTQVRFQTNRGEVVLSGNEFKEIFNTRAPGYIAIPQSSFSFFNIERK